jgi:hypothetical protein
MKKIVINKCHGGFGLSDDAVMRYGELAGLNLVKTTTNYGFSMFYKEGRVDDALHFYEGHIERDDKYLVEVVEEMGDKACGRYADLKVVEIPDGAQWQIEEYDGWEHIAEKHRTWG